MPHSFFIGLGLTRHSLAQTIADISEKAERSVVRIDVKTAEGEGIGSGYVIDPVGVIVTNCHVMAGATSATVVFSDKKAYPVDGIYLIDKARDIAVIRVNATGLTPMKLSTNFPARAKISWRWEHLGI